MQAALLKRNGMESSCSTETLLAIPKYPIIPSQDTIKVNIVQIGYQLVHVLVINTNSNTVVDE